MYLVITAVSKLGNTKHSHSRIQLLEISLYQISLRDLVKNCSSSAISRNEVSLGLEWAIVDLPNHLDGIYGAVIGWDSSAFSGSIRGFILGCWHPAQKRLEFCFVAEDLRTIRLGAQSTAQHPSLIFAVLTRRHPTYPSPHHLSRALTPSYPTSSPQALLHSIPSPIPTTSPILTPPPYPPTPAPIPTSLTPFSPHLSASPHSIFTTTGDHGVRMG